LYRYTTDEVSLVYAVDLAEDAFRSTYTEPAPPPLGGPVSAATADLQAGLYKLNSVYP
jgi:hypothetical protein